MECDEQLSLCGLVLKVGMVLCPWGAKLLLFMPEDRWVQELLYCIIRFSVIVSSKDHVPGLSPFPSQSSYTPVSHPFSSHFAKLFVFFLLLAPCPSFFTQSFRDFHFPNIFYSSVVDSLPVPEFCFVQSHSHQEVLLSLSPHQLSFFYFLPRFSANAISFLIPPSSWFLVFLFLPKLAGKVSFPPLIFYIYC